MNLTEFKGYLYKNMCNVDIWVKRTLKQVSSGKVVFICEDEMGYNQQHTNNCIIVLVHKCYHEK